MIEELKLVNWEQILEALQETLYMSFVSLFFTVIIGLATGIVLYSTRTNGLYENKFINKAIDFIVNVLRAIPFIILMFLIIPFTKLLTGSMLGVNAALPSLIIAASPFYARLCVLAFMEVDKGVIEATKAMGATNFQIIRKVIIPEAKPALVSGIGVCAISLISYTAMAGAIGSGGLGNLAYLYGLARRNDAVLYIATILVIAIVFTVQGLNDLVVKKIDKR
ncbi:MAG: methionine ABC transporter permease [Bacilli bacterium]